LIVTRLSLTDYRNYESAELELVPGPNLFVGSNGQGKTNLVEALGYLSTLGSHRVAGDAALIRSGADSGVIRARLEHGERNLLLEVQLNRGGANRAQVNRGAVKPRELPRHIATVLFAPEDLALVRGEPSGRRRFLDQLLVQLTPRLSSVFADYERVVRQRNTLLKSARGARLPESGLTTLEIWNERLIDLGSEIIEARGALVARLRPHVEQAYIAIAGESQRAELANELSILGAQPDEDPAVEDAALRTEISAAEAVVAFTNALTQRRRAELDRGLTLVGPHRDDLLLTLNRLPARTHASHGESWSFALSLKLASAELLRAESPAGDPVLILDDVFAELDQDRRGRLAAAVRDYEQVLITAAVFGDVPEEFATHVIRIEAGRILGGEDS
jgi:DNA replication and repair protein RecF